ncbi:MAG: 5-formyltetrahydrofolate cyclo-ligase [Patescibacteria group bacterium]
MEALPVSLQTILYAARAVISYSPRPDEPNPSGIPFLSDVTISRILLPGLLSVDPIALARETSSSLPATNVVILIPGRAFDRFGTRHGRGGGWYDRFLSAVPHEWIRIGVGRAQDVSETPLVRQSWDEPVDWLLIESDDEWQVVETKARLQDTPHDTSHLSDQS